MSTSGGCDILLVLGFDVCSNILCLLDDPADLVRASSLSRSWYRFVLEGGFCKRLCLKLFPEVSTASHAIEEDQVIGIVEALSSNYRNIGTSERNHKVYATLSRALSPTLRKDCISEASDASSTDNYPLERVDNTLEPCDRIRHRPSYWSSTGATDDGVPEILTYKLASALCLITEINIQPFQVYFHPGNPIFSAKSVRFRMGYFKYPMVPPKHNLIKWTYVSPDYPMTQENVLQKFKLPVPVLCIGGILQIELLGRAQKCFDGLFYICVSHVQAVGRILLPGFEVNYIDSAGKCALSYSRLLKGGDGENPRFLPDILITVKRSGEDPVTGVVRYVLQDGSCNVWIESSRETVTVHPSEIEIVTPRKSDKVKIMSGAQRGYTGKLIYVDGTKGIVRVEIGGSTEVKILDMVDLAKLIQ